MTTFNVLNSLNTLVAGAVEVQKTDMTETGGGSFERVLLPVGTYNGHFAEYVEYGKILPMFQGKPTGRPPVLNVKVGFIMYGPNGEVAYLRSPKMPVSNSEKARFKKFFDRLNVKGDVKHTAQKLGQAFRLEVGQYEKEGKSYNTLQLETLSPLPKFDPETGEAIKLPELKAEDVKLFLWDNPTQETWDSLYIEGTNEKTGKSKNFIQEDILKAVDYNGSPLQSLLEGGVPSPESLVAAPVSVATAGADVAPTAGVAPSAPAAPSAPTAPTAPAAPSAPAAPVAPTAPTV